MSRPVRIGLLGLGTVGQGVVRVLRQNRDEIARRLGRGVALAQVYTRKPERAKGVDLEGVALVHDAHAVTRNKDIDVVVEAIGGLSPARELILEAIAGGKAVVTANKALLAEDGNRIFAAARDQGVIVAFEASVAGGIPIIKAIREGMAGNRVDEIAGIINGTSNYILTQMSERGVDFAAALKEAQEHGYAEADPRLDVDGIDAAHKLSILAAIAFGMPLSFPAVTSEGLRHVTAQDIGLAKELGYRIKPLAIAKRAKGGVELRVHPTLVRQDHMLAKVDGALNSIVVQGNAVGATGYYGRGAGGDATASAIVADLVDVARLLEAGARHHVPSLGFDPAAVREQPVVAIRDVECAHYLRLRVADTPGVLKAITSILAELDISVEAILQKEPRGKEDATLAIITSSVPQHRFEEALGKIQALKFVRTGSTHLRVEHFNGKG